MSEATALRLAAAIERLAELLEAREDPGEAISFQLGPILPKHRPRAVAQRR